MISLFIDIESFEQQWFIIERFLQLGRLKQYMVTILIDQSLSNCSMYKHRCMENINKLYTYAAKFDDQIQCKSIIEAPMVSTPDRFTDNSPMSPGTPMIVKKCSASKSLFLFIEVLNVKNKTSVHQLGAAK